MNRSKLRGYVAGPKVSIKDRVGLPKSTLGSVGGRKGIVSRKLPSQGQGKLLASRLGLPVKSRIGVGVGGVRGGLSTAGGGGKRKGLVSDARDKIILNRVSKGGVRGGIVGRTTGAGRVGGGLGRGRLLDARSKIDARRSTQKKPGPVGLRSQSQGQVGNAKLKSLKIIANVANTPRPGVYTGPASSRYSSEGGRPGPGPSSRERATAAYRREPVSHGYFANQPYSGESPGGRGSLRISVAGGPGSQHMHLQSHPHSHPHPQHHQHGPPMDPRMMGGSSADNLFLTRTVTNYQSVGGGAPSSASSSRERDNRGWSSSVAKVAPSFASRSGGGYGPEDMDMDDEIPQRIRISNSLQSRLDSHDEESPRYKLIVSNLQPTVTTEDIVELFSDINTPISASITSPGHAEVVYSKKGDCLKAVEAYHNRLLDGSPMRVFMENSSTSLKSAGGATMKLPKASSSVKIQPDISAIHKVLFNPSSGNSTRGLFKGGQ